MQMPLAQTKILCIILVLLKSVEMLPLVPTGPGFYPSSTQSSCFIPSLPPTHRIQMVLNERKFTSSPGIPMSGIFTAGRLQYIEWEIEPLMLWVHHSSAELNQIYGSPIWRKTVIDQLSAAYKQTKAKMLSTPQKRKSPLQHHRHLSVIKLESKLIPGFLASHGY